MLFPSLLVWKGSLGKMDFLYKHLTPSSALCKTIRRNRRARTIQGSSGLELLLNVQHLAELMICET